MGKQQDEDTNEDKSPEGHDAEDSAREDRDGDEETHHGEGHGNLRRRSDWFQKRHGGG